MSNLQKLGVFLAVLIAVPWILARFPKSRLSRLAHLRFGPVRRADESGSNFLARFCLYALICLAQIAFLAACGYLWARWVPSITDDLLFQAFWFVALPLLAVAAGLGLIFAAGLAILAKCLEVYESFRAVDRDDSSEM